MPDSAPSIPHLGGDRPYFLITIDTEGDDIWSKPRTVSTRNADFLPRFQSLCESHGLKPTYLTNFEMANSNSFQEFGKEVLKRHAGEIGMHLHAWDTPPLIPLTDDDFFFQPYLTEYPEDIMRAKIAAMTTLLKETFGIRPVSHRAGRWSLNETYAAVLAELEYLVDCSVTPHVSWKRTSGNPEGDGGTDYSEFPDSAYFLDLTELSCAGDSTLLEVPITILAAAKPIANQVKNFPLVGRVVRRFISPPRWLRPTGKNLQDMLSILREARLQKRSYVELVLHSSELMPGGSPTFTTEDHIEALYHDLHALFSEVQVAFAGATLKDYYYEVRKHMNHQTQDAPNESQGE